MARSGVRRFGEDTLTERKLLQAGRQWLWVAALLALSACGGAPAGHGPTAPAKSGEEGYRAPPALSAVAAAPHGGLELSGAAGPGDAVRLATPAGGAEFATADAKGAWRMTLPQGATPGLFGLSMSDAGRVVQASDFLFLTPEGGAVRLRPGGGSETLNVAAGRLTATAIDIDAKLAATLSGGAAAGDEVGVWVDGVERGRATADNAGRFVIALNQPLTAGAHQFELAGASGRVRFATDVSPPTPLGAARFRAAPLPVGWRVDWVTPGGGEQTTMLLRDQPPAPAGAAG